MKIIYKNVEDLIPYVNNTRTHSKEQVNQIASSIKEFGFTNPVLIDEQGGIIAGHGRIMGAKLLKMDEVPTICLDGLSEAQKKAYIIADNKLALNAGWDEDLLRLELMTLDEMGFNYSDLGFDFDFDIEELNNEENEPNLKEQDYEEKTEIIIECESELQQEELFYKLTNEGYKCRVQGL
jgi:ParB-like chromosome segregation protein Spo0J